MADAIHQFAEGEKGVEVPPIAPERARVELPEAGTSEVVEVRENALPGEETPHAEVQPRVTAQAPAQAIKTDLLKRVEKILEEEVGEVYFTMNPTEQAQFKKKGEETARTIEGLIARARATATYIVALIKAWLRLIPGVSTFFLEQEAKIKTDKLMHLQQRRKE